MFTMDIAFIFSGIAFVAVSNWLQPNNYRKPKANRYLANIGGILWLLGIVLAFLHYHFIHAVLLLLASFLVGAVLRINKS